MREDKVMKNKVVEFRNGIFTASSRTYGEIIMEPIVRKVLGLSKSSTSENDAENVDGEFVEIKCSKVLLTPKKEKNITIVERVLLDIENNELNRLVKFDDCYDSKYLSNMQNIKRHKFSKLRYVMLFEDCLKIFESDTEDISNIPNWSGKHGRYDKLGKSGQFGITKNNIEWHLKNNLVATLTWDEVYEISKGIIG